MGADITPTKHSIRNRIGVELARRFSTQVKGAPASDPYPFKWTTVQREPLTDGSQRKAYELAVIDGPEQKAVNIQNYDATLQVTLEWRAMFSPKCDPAEEANAILTAIERRVNEDIQLTEPGGDRLALRAWVSNTDYVIDNEVDRQIDGVVTVQVLYRHKVADPRDRF